MIPNTTPIGTKVKHIEDGVVTIIKIFSNSAEYLSDGGVIYTAPLYNFTIIEANMKEYLEKQIRIYELEVERSKDEFVKAQIRHSKIEGMLEQARATLAHLLAAN